MAPFLEALFVVLITQRLRLPHEGGSRLYEHKIIDVRIKDSEAQLQNFELLEK